MNTKYRFSDVVQLLIGPFANHPDAPMVLSHIQNFKNVIGTRGGFDGRIKKLSPSLHSLIW